MNYELSAICMFFALAGLIVGSAFLICGGSMG